MFFYIADQDNTNNENLNTKPNTNPNTNPNPNTQTPEQNMDEGNDRNTEILARLGEALENITNTIANAHGALYNISSYRDSQ